jgi:hypothetical protein
VLYGISVKKYLANLKKKRIFKIKGEKTSLMKKEKK